MLIWIELIDRITEKYVWHPCFHGCFEEFFKEVFRAYFFFKFESIIFFTLFIKRCEFISKHILKFFSGHIFYFFWIKKSPVSIFFDTFHKYIGNCHRWKYIKCFTTNISSFSLQIKEVKDISVPDVERNRNSSCSRSELIDGDGSIVDDFYPWVDSRAHSLHSTNGSSFRTDISKIYSYTSSKF